MFADEFESDEAAPVDLERAKELVLALCDSLIAGTTASQTDAKPDQARYRRDRSQLGTILKRAGIREPFPWPRIAEALAAAKTEHYGNGSHRKRTQYFQSRAQNVLELLDTGSLTATVETSRQRSASCRTPRTWPCSTPWLCVANLPVPRPRFPSMPAPRSARRRL
jgi:hypothetical protein